MQSGDILLFEEGGGYKFYDCHIIFLRKEDEKIWCRFWENSSKIHNNLYTTDERKLSVFK